MAAAPSSGRWRCPEAGAPLHASMDSPADAASTAAHRPKATRPPRRSHGTTKDQVSWRTRLHQWYTNPRARRRTTAKRLRRKSRYLRQILNTGERVRRRLFAFTRQRSPVRNQHRPLLLLSTSPRISCLIRWGWAARPTTTLLQALDCERV